jgi:cystathionine beta-lyase
MTSPADRLRQQGGLKWTFYDEDVLPAWVAEMDFGLAPPITEALHDAVDRGLTGYPYPALEHAVARAATEFWVGRFGWNVDPSWVFPAPDVIEGIRRCIMRLTRPGTPVVLHTPVYFPFFSMVERAGREIVEVPCEPDENGHYKLDLDGIEAGLAAGAGSVVICNPWNPTGRVLSRRELEDVMELATRHDARVIADEIHSVITYPGATHVPIATIDPERSVTVTAASKAWNLPGLKCAQVVLTSQRDRQAWNDYYAPYMVGVGTFGLVASQAAYAGGTPWFDDILERLESNRDLLTSLLSEELPEIVFGVPEGTYLAWLDLSSFELDNPMRHLREHARVALTDGDLFRGGSSKWARLNFATEPEILIEAVGRMEKTLRSP